MEEKIGKDKDASEGSFNGAISRLGEKLSATGHAQRVSAYSA